MSRIHFYYDQLNDHERSFVDDQFKRIFLEAKYNPFNPILLHGNDDAEVAVDTLARLIVISRATNLGVLGDCMSSVERMERRTQTK